MADFSVNCTKIIKGALRALGALGTGQSLSSEEQDDAVQALNMLVTQLMGPPSYIMKGIQPWRRERSSVTPAARALYELKPSGGDLDISIPVRVTSCRIKETSTGDETLLDPMGFNEYDALENKTEVKAPTAYYYERRLDVGYLYLDSIPLNHANYTLEITYLDQLGTFETVRTDVDFPQEYYRVLKYALAVDLGPEYGVDIAPLKVLRDEAIAQANIFHEDDDFYFAENDFSINANKIVKGALRAAGAIKPGESMSNDSRSSAFQALNMLVTQFMGPPSYMMRGMKPWQRERGTITLAAKSLYEIKPTGGDLDVEVPVKILSARLKDANDNEIQLKKLTTDEYDNITNKAQEISTPTAFYYERHIDVGNLYLSCIPSDINLYTLEITYLDQISTFTAVTSDIDFPTEFYRVLKFALAVDIAPEYDMRDVSLLKILRDEAVALANTFNTDETFYSFQPGID